MLVRMPVYVGMGPINPKAVVRTTFYVLSNDAHYALIFGRTFLHDIKGLLDLKHHRLQYATAAGHTMATNIPLSEAHHQPIYHEVAHRLWKVSPTSTPTSSTAPLPDRQAPAPKGAEQYLPPELHSLALAPEEDVPLNDPLWSPA